MFWEFILNRLNILGIRIDFWLTPLVFLNLFMVFQKAKNSFFNISLWFLFPQPISLPHNVQQSVPHRPHLSLSLAAKAWPPWGQVVEFWPVLKLVNSICCQVNQKKKLKINRVRSDWCEVWGQKIFNITHFLVLSCDLPASHMIHSYFIDWTLQIKL